jgi:uncharacterized protein YjbI with pentapeptide repeats
MLFAISFSAAQLSSAQLSSAQLSGNDDVRQKFALAILRLVD